MGLLLRRLSVSAFSLGAGCTCGADRSRGGTDVAQFDSAGAGDSDTCTDNARDDTLDPDDQAEATNRQIFAANMAVDRNAAKPAATAYKHDLPGAVRGGAHNFVTNLSEPKVLVRDVSRCGRPPRRGAGRDQRVRGARPGLLRDSAQRQRQAPHGPGGRGPSGPGSTGRCNGGEGVN